MAGEIVTHCLYRPICWILGRLIVFQSRLGVSWHRTHLLCVGKATQDFFSKTNESSDRRLTLCWANISQWSTACLKYWYSLQSVQTGYRTYPLSLCSSCTAGCTYNRLLQTHTLTTHILITHSTFIISCSFRCVGLNWQGLFLITLFLARLSHLEVY